ncbi:hypothetical protein [[Limnothrix rosea] IAM M-220]|uniref:hypothetical protein n=1 Tax=[Limnothrix rosea] IAM M-220 TaxID=454133 RepID=UPI0009659FD3|nr:hypothetical protein [[Limnothrix rosea] IAM M-220]OKH18286.1 hypothetical protein NIES208_06045 [[Limnothrix rosea] IAM M-220]
MLTPHCLAADKQVEFTIVALFQPCLKKSETWLQSLLRQGHRCRTEVLLVLPPLANRVDYKRLWQQLLEDYREVIVRSPYSFAYQRAPDLDYPIAFNRALNQAVCVANGEWIYLSPTDNQLTKSAFFEFTAVLKDCPDVALISGRFNRLKENQQVLEKSPILEPEGVVANTFKYHFLYQNPLNFGSTIFRKYLWQKSGGIKPELAQSALWELFRRLSHGYFRWYYVPRCICNIDLSEEIGQLFNNKGQLSPSFLQVIVIKHACYSYQEILRAQEAIARQLFQYINDCFQDDRYAQGYLVIVEFLKCINLGDRLWLEYLRKMDQTQITYKQEIFNIIQLVKQRCLV